MTIWVVSNQSPIMAFTSEVEARKWIAQKVWRSVYTIEEITLKEKA